MTAEVAWDLEKLGKSKWGRMKTVGCKVSWEGPETPRQVAPGRGCQIRGLFEVCRAWDSGHFFLHSAHWSSQNTVKHTASGSQYHPHLNHEELVLTQSHIECQDSNP